MRLALAAAVALPAFAALAADAAPAAAASAPEDARATIERMLARELSPLTPRPFRTPRGVEGTVEAAAAPEVSGGDPSDEVVIPLGTQLPVTCRVFGERLDTGAVIWRMAEAAGGTVKVVALQPVQIAAVAGSPLVLAQMTYQVQREAGPMVGRLKLAVYAHDTRSLLCHHDEPGYGETFERVVTGLAASLRGGAADERAGARFAEIAVMRIGSLPVGYSEHVVWDRQGGGSVSSTYGSQLLPRSASQLIAVDTFTEEQLDGKDLLVAGTYVHLTNGDLDTRISLSRADDRTFRYEGEKDAKPLAGTFTTKAGLSSDLWFARRFAKGAAAAPKDGVRHEAYSFEANPVGPVPVVYRADPAGSRRARVELGPIRLAGELDEHGLFASGELPIGPTKLVIERIWSRGSP